MNIIEYIPMGHDNLITREELVRRTGESDRKIRMAIRSAQNAGHEIINVDGGYFRYKDEDDLPYLRTYYMRERARAHDCMLKQRIVRRMYERHDANQITLEEFGWG